VVHQHGEAAVAAGLSPLEHLPTSTGVAHGEDRGPADLGLDVLDLRPTLVGGADLGHRPPHDRLAGTVAVEPVAD